MANEFFTILTGIGRNKLAAAVAAGTQLALTQMAVGDGDNGAYYNPIEAQTALKHEVWRGAINSLYVDPNNANWIVAELVIPDDVGGWYIREVGLFDSTGALIAVGKFPESYKPILAAGSNKQLYVRMILEVTNTSAVTLQVDPSVVLATRQYVDSKVTSEINKLDGKQSVRVATTAAIALTGLQTIDGVALAAGDRVLVKNQAAAADNGIYVVAAGAWTRAADADASIEVTPGLFVPVEQGATNADSIWQLVTDAPITLGTTALTFEMVDGKTGITAGTYRSVTVNVRGQVTGGTNPTTLAGYGITDAAGSQPGAVCYFLANVTPTGWLKANGAAVSRTVFAGLFATIGTTFGAGDGVTTFNLPDLRGEFIRSWDDSRGVDVGRGLGSWQAGGNQEHYHLLPTSTGNDIQQEAGITGVFLDGNGTQAGTAADTSSLPAGQRGNNSGLIQGQVFRTYQQSTGGPPAFAEARPRNVALLACIKY